LNNKISPNKVVTCLRCSGIFNHQFIANSALRPLVKEFGKLINIWRSYEQE